MLTPTELCVAYDENPRTSQANKTGGSRPTCKCALCVATTSTEEARFAKALRIWRAQLRRTPHTSLPPRRNGRTEPSLGEKYHVSTDLVKQHSRQDVFRHQSPLVACADIISHLERIWELRFAAGLPLPLLRKALFWISATPNRQRAHATQPEDHLPSWLWAGLSNRICYYIIEGVPLVRTFEITTTQKVTFIRVSPGTGCATFVEEQNAGAKNGSSGFNTVPFALHSEPNLLIFDAVTILDPELTIFEAEHVDSYALSRVPVQLTSFDTCTDDVAPVGYSFSLGYPMCPDLRTPLRGFYSLYIEAYRV